MTGAISSRTGAGDMDRSIPTIDGITVGAAI
jgi:hypothetical protein